MVLGEVCMAVSGRLWLESPVGLEPPPSPTVERQGKLRGEYHSVKGLDHSLFHCGEGQVWYSQALFPHRMAKVAPTINELEEVGFNALLSAQVAEAEATALPAVGAPSSLPSLAALDLTQGPVSEEASRPSFATTMTAMTMTILDDDELKNRKLV